MRKSNFLLLTFFPLLWWGLFLSSPPTASYTALTGNQESLQKLLQQWEKSFFLPKNSSPFTVYPQTYASASSLLSLVSYKNVVGLPEGFKGYTPLYSDLDEIPEISDRNLDILNSRKPNLAFISKYSHPGIVARLSTYQIPLITLSTPQNVEEIQNQFIDLGNILKTDQGKVLAELYKSLYEQLIEQIKVASLLKKPRILFLDYTGELTGFHQPLWEDFLHQIPFLETQLDKPHDAVIISVSSDPRVRYALLNHPALRHLKNIYLIDQRHAHFPSHLTLLAFFEFAEVYIRECLK